MTGKQIRRSIMNIIKKQKTKSAKELIKVLGIISAVLIFIDVVGEFITFINIGL